MLIGYVDNTPTSTPTSTLTSIEQIHPLENQFMLYPDSPRHPRQKYLLTIKGNGLFNRLKISETSVKNSDE